MASSSPMVSGTFTIRFKKHNKVNKIRERCKTSVDVLDRYNRHDTPLSSRTQRLKVDEVADAIENDDAAMTTMLIVCIAKATYRFRTKFGSGCKSDEMLSSSEQGFIPSSIYRLNKCIQSVTHVYDILIKYVTDVEYPEKNKLRFFDKVPVTSTTQRPKKMKKQKILTRGPELIHNKLQYGDYGIQATAGGNLRQAHLEMVRLTLNRKMDDSRMFAMWRVDQPWKSVTKKGQGHRMGGGKGSIDHYVFPVKAGRLIVEMGGNCEFEEVARMLRQVAQKLPFAARVVNREILEMDEMREKFYKENNINPFTFEYLIKHNFLGCGKFMSPYDKIWHGKYR